MLSGVFGDLPLRDDLELLLIRGVRHFNFTHYLQNIFIPILLPLLDLLAPPYFLSRLLGMYVGKLRIMVVYVSIICMCMMCMCMVCLVTISFYY
ncbi:hypothetical protein EON65_52750 [archaeon]|nr:MAG: hypothetical protein EON65_52750 [archaeon]